MLVREQSKVKIRGLDAFLNGQDGTCEAWLPDKQRWRVLLDNGNRMDIKTDNLLPQLRPGADLLREQPEAIWACACGFKNSEKNTICGGAGPMGCKARRDSAASMMTGPASFWMCNMCGFKNSSRNTRCGGNGTMGCKAERLASTEAQLPPLTGWRCTCGFINNALNAKCGGTGPKGCKAERPSQLASTLPSTFTTSWKCIQCGFNNSAVNTKCGGTGPMGCKAERDQAMEASVPPPLLPPPPQVPIGLGGCGFLNGACNTVSGGTGLSECKENRYADWTCECGYVNAYEDTICGGSGRAYLGCKSQRPPAASAAIGTSDVSANRKRERPPAPSAATGNNDFSANRKRIRPAVDREELPQAGMERNQPSQRESQPSAPAKKHKRPSFPPQDETTEDNGELESWLRGLDLGKGAMLQYLDLLKQEFGDLIQLAAAAQPYDKRTSIVNAVAKEVYDSLGMQSLGHRLLLAKGIIALSQRTAT